MRRRVSWLGINFGILETCGIIVRVVQFSFMVNKLTAYAQGQGTLEEKTFTDPCTNIAHLTNKTFCQAIDDRIMGLCLLIL